MSVIEFLRTFEEFLGRNGRERGGTPWAFVEGWESLVDTFEDGYDWSYDEYLNDVSNRGLLEKAFNDERLKVFEPQIEAMRERVTQADARLKKLFLPGVEIGGTAGWSWWERGVLANGVGEYAEDLKRRFDIELPGLDPRS
jgi:hypothetical protein